MTIDGAALKIALGIVGLRYDYTDPIQTPPLPVVSFSLVDAIIAHNNANDDRGKGLARAYWLGAPDIPESTISLREFIDAFLRAIIAVFQSRNLMHLAEYLRRETDLQRMLGDIATRIAKFEVDSIVQQDAIRRFLKLMPGSSGSVGLTNITESMFSNSASSLSFTDMLNSIGGGLPFGNTDSTENPIFGFLKEFYSRLVIDSMKQVEDPAPNSSAENGMSLVDAMKTFVMARLNVATEAEALTALESPQYAVLKTVWDTAVTTSSAWTNSSGTGILDVVQNNVSYWTDDLAFGIQEGFLNLSTAGLPQSEINKLQLTTANLTTFINNLTSLQTFLNTNNGVTAGSNYDAYITSLQNDFTAIDIGNIFGSEGFFEQAASMETNVWSPGDEFVTGTYYFNSGDGFFYQALKDIKVVSDKTAVTNWSATDFSSGAIVKHNYNYYKANESVTDEDVPGTSSKWTEIRVAENYTSGHTYTSQEMVVHGGEIFEALGTVTGISPAADTEGNYWAPLSYNNSSYFNLNTNFIFQIGLKARSAIQAAQRASDFFDDYAGTWSSNTDYSLGDFVVHNGSYYRIAANTDYEGAPVAETTYTAGDILLVGSTRYIVNPSQSILADIFNAATEYVSGDFVYDNGYYWRKTVSVIPDFSVDDEYDSSTGFFLSPTGVQYKLKNDITITQTEQAYTEADAEEAISHSMGDVVTYEGNKYIAETSSSYSGETALELEEYFADTTKWQAYTSTNPADYATFFEQVTAPSQGSPTYWQQMDTTGAAWLSSLEALGKVQNYNAPLPEFFTLSSSTAANAGRYVEDLNMVTSSLKTFYQSSPSKIDVVVASAEASYGQIAGYIQDIQTSFRKVTNGVNDATSNTMLAIAIKNFIDNALTPNKSMMMTNPNQSFSDPSATDLAANKTLLTSWYNALDTDTNRPTGTIGVAMGDVILKIQAMIDGSNNMAITSEKQQALNTSMGTLTDTVSEGYTGALITLASLLNRMKGSSSIEGDSSGLVTGTTINFEGSLQRAAFAKLDELREAFTSFQQPATWSSATNYRQGDYVKGSDGEYYISLIANNSGSGNNPASNANPTKWRQVPAREVLSTWRAGETYGMGDYVQGSDGIYYKSLISNNVGADNNPAGGVDPNKWQAVDLNVIAALKAIDLRTSARELEGSLAYRHNASGNRLTNVLTAQQGIQMQEAMLRAFQLEGSGGLAGGTPTHLRVRMFVQEWSSSTTYSAGAYVQTNTAAGTRFYQAAQSSTNVSLTNPSYWTMVPEAQATAAAGSPELYYLYALRQIAAHDNNYWKNLRDLAVVAADPPTIGTGNGLLKQLKDKYNLLADSVNMASESSRSVCETNSNRLTYLNQDQMSSMRTHFDTYRNDIIGIMNEINNTLTREDFSTDANRWTSDLVVGTGEMTALKASHSWSTQGGGWITDIVSNSATQSLFDNVKAGNAGTVKYFAPIADAAVSILKQLSGFQNFFHNTGVTIHFFNSQAIQGSPYQFATWGRLSGRFQDVFYDLYNGWGDFGNHFAGYRVRRTGTSNGNIGGGGWGSVVSTGKFGDKLDRMYEDAKGYFGWLNTDLDNWQRNYNDFHLATITQAELWVSRAYATTAPGEDIFFQRKEADDISPEERRLMAKILNLLISILVAMLSANIQVRSAVFRLLNGEISLDQLGSSLRISTRLANNMIQRAAAVAADMLERERSSKSNSAEFVASNPISTQTLYDLASFWQANRFDQKEVEEVARQQRRYS